MPKTHKLVRDAIEAVMRDDANGFNAKLAAALPDYGITDQIALDWGPGNTNVLYARLAGGDFQLSKLDGRLTLEVAPDGSQWTGETRGVKWSGIVGVRLIFRVTYSFRDGDTEPPEEDVVYSVATAIEDAVIEVFQQPTQLDPRLIYAKPPDCPEGYILTELEDGVEITLPISVGFKVSTN
jgi:hypothetical protein